MCQRNGGLIKRVMNGSLSDKSRAGAPQKDMGGYKIKLHLGNTQISKVRSRSVAPFKWYGVVKTPTVCLKWFTKKSRYCLFSPQYAVSIVSSEWFTPLRCLLFFPKNNGTTHYNEKILKTRYGGIGLQFSALSRFNLQRSELKESGKLSIVERRIALNTDGEKFCLRNVQQNETKPKHNDDSLWSPLSKMLRSPVVC